MKATHENFASFFQSLRKAQRISLRDFCESAHADPGNTSRMERGVIPPPQDRDNIKRLRDQGWSVEQIAHAMKRSIGEIELTLELSSRK